MNEIEILQYTFENGTIPTSLGFIAYVLFSKSKQIINRLDKIIIQSGDKVNLTDEKNNICVCEITKINKEK